MHHLPDGQLDWILQIYPILIALAYRRDVKYGHFRCYYLTRKRNAHVLEMVSIREKTGVLYIQLE